MTFQEFENQLDAMPSLDACETWLKDNAHTLRELFYQNVGEATSKPSYVAGECDFAASALITLLNKFGSQIRSVENTKPEIKALLIYFISLCEHANFHAHINRIVQILPAGSLRSRAAVIFKYKNINIASCDYIDRFKEIAPALQSVWAEASPSLQLQCEYLAIEYYCLAAAPGNGIGENNRKILTAQFAEHATEYPVLAVKRITNLFYLSADTLKETRSDANIRIAESFYDEAAVLLPLPLRPLHTAVCAGKSHINNGYCPPGFPEARTVLAEQYPEEFANTGYFIQQALTKDVYIDFDDATKCMRYFRQYMPLHMPQIEKAVRNTLDQNPFAQKNLHVIDVGGGPGTLYVVLASLLHRGL